MQIETIPVGFLKENCYILTQDNNTIIIDPGAEAEKIIASCQNKNIVGILITHHHFDHIGALKAIKEKFNVSENSVIPSFTYEVIATPGHTSDSVTYYFPKENIMFTGDFIFNGTIGRTDLPTGSKEDMQSSLAKIQKYPGSIKIYPGHGAPTTLAAEIPNFPYYLS